MISRALRTPLPAPPLPAGRPRLVVAGFTGTGKTEAGWRAARALGLPFIDLDQVIERRLGMSVRAIFARSGETGFRHEERKALADAARLSGTVVAAGGGSVLSRDAFALLAEHGVVIPLTCEPNVLALRLRKDHSRPLLQPDPPARIRTLLRERDDLYRSLGEPLDTTALTADEAGHRIVRRYPAAVDACVRIEVAGPAGPYPVLIGAGAIDAAGVEIARVLPEAARALIVADGSIAASVETRISRPLEAAGLLALPPIILPPGENAKTLETAAMLWRRFHEEGLGPSDVVVAVGGGAALDVAGFAAATFARGLPTLNVPTTLLAMVDASVGGKVGIDHEGVKNRVGAFHHPVAVAADPTMLRGLPGRTLRAGLAECVKVALLASPLVLDLLEGAPEEIETTDRRTWIIEQSVRIKAGYVAEDPGDQALRHSLNLGHTFAHAIEAASAYTVPHGEAVAMGLLAAARLGVRAGITEPALEARLEGLLTRLELPTCPPPHLDRGRLLAGMSADKKRRSGRDVFVVPAADGAELLEGDLVEEALDALLPQVAEESIR